MILSDSCNRFGGRRLRQALARALAAALCLVVVAGGVLHIAIAHADDHARSETAFAAVAGPGIGPAGTDDGQNAVDSCSLAPECPIWTIPVLVTDWDLPVGAALRASNETRRGINAPVHRRPPRLSFIV